jgi:hypothetical protein
MAIVGGSFIPSDILYQVFSLLDVRSLGRVQQASPEFYNLGNNDLLWQELFQRAFSQNVPNGELGKEALKKWHLIPDRIGLSKVLATFFCCLKWEKTTCLQCRFPDPSMPSIIITQSFGPHKEVLNGKIEDEKNIPVDEMRHYWHGVSNQTYTPSGGWTIKKLLSSVPYRRVVSTPITLPLQDWRIDQVFIEEVDVGFGNTLGYYSSINEWKEPFEFFCISGVNGQQSIQWCGLILSDFSEFKVEFKFVKIDPVGNVTWENYPGNRQPDEIKGWKNYLTKYPITFPS